MEVEISNPVSNEPTEYTAEGCRAYVDGDAALQMRDVTKFLIKRDEGDPHASELWRESEPIS